MSRGVLLRSLGGWVSLGSRKSYPYPVPDQILQVLLPYTMYQNKNAQLFFISVFCERSR